MLHPEKNIETLENVTWNRTASGEDIIQISHNIKTRSYVVIEIRRCIKQTTSQYDSTQCKDNIF